LLLPLNLHGIFGATILEGKDDAPKRNTMSLCESPNFLSGAFIDNKSLPKIESALTPRRPPHVF
jgi:hypothetical protein